MTSTDPWPQEQPRRPEPIKYRIRQYFGPSVIGRWHIKDIPDPEFELGDVVEHETRITILPDGFYHALALDDQMFADQIVRLVQRACAYFYEHDDTYEPMSGIPGKGASDAEVRARIARLNAGENLREAERTHKERYDLEKLPWNQQRALIEKIDELKREWGFQFINDGGR